MINLVSLYSKVRYDQYNGGNLGHLHEGCLLRGGEMGAKGVADAVLYFASEESAFVSGPNPMCKWSLYTVVTE